MIEESQEKGETKGRGVRRCRQSHFYLSQLPLPGSLWVFRFFIGRISLWDHFCSVLQGFRGFPGRTGSTGLDGEKVMLQFASE